MRVGFDAAVLAPGSRTSGTGRYAFQLLRHVAGSPHEFVLYAPPGCERPQGLPPQFTWRPLPALPLGKLSALATHLWLLPRLAARNRLDLLHVPAVHPRISRPPIPRRLPCPLVVTLHDLIPLTFRDSGVDPYPWRIRAFFRWNIRALRTAARIITVSDASRREILSHLPIGTEKVVAIHNGVEMDGAAPEGEGAPIDVPAPYILSLGSADPRKNLPGLLSAYTRAAASGLPHHLVIVTDAYSRRSLLQDSAGNGLRPSVHILSGVSDEALWRLYRGAELFVFPSLAEGFGFPPLEAMAAGVPVIASDLPALREVLGDAARLVAPGSEEALQEALLEVASQPESRRRLQEAGPLQAARYSWRECARRTLETYEDAAGYRRRPAPAAGVQA